MDEKYTTGEGCRSPSSKGCYHQDNAFAYFDEPDGEKWIASYVDGELVLITSQDGEDRLKLLLARGWTYMDKDDIEVTFGTIISWPIDSPPVPILEMIDCVNFSKPLPFAECSLRLDSHTGLLHWVKLQRIMGDDLYMSYCWSESDASPKKIDSCKYGGGHLYPWRAECARWALVTYGM